MLIHWNYLKNIIGEEQIHLRNSYNDLRDSNG